jgi:eukaryotic-like serine/threonine-protein kinase
LKNATPAVNGVVKQIENKTESKRPSGAFTNNAGISLIPIAGAHWWAAETETTQAQFERVMGVNPSLFRDPVRPVERVTWYDAKEFCRRLTESESSVGRIPNGFEYRLPTADEFDHMLGAGSLQDTVTSVEQVQWATAPVGSKPANSRGLYDVVGNVWEWCDDWWDNEHRFKVSKGGSWTNSTGELVLYSGAATERDWNGVALIDRLYGPYRRDYPNQAFWDRGFRVVLAPANPMQTKYLKDARRNR